MRRSNKYLVATVSNQSGQPW